MQATLDLPLSLDPRQAAKLVVRSIQVDFLGRTVAIEYDLIDSGGNVLDRSRKITSSGAVQTWITNQENTIYSALLAKLGVAGVVA